MGGTTAPEWLIPFPGGRTTVDGELSQAPNPTWWGSLIGAQTDGSKLEYKRNRYYDPHTGRFTQEDPIGLAGGLNLYGFAEGDPVNFDDPFGLCPPADTNLEDCETVQFWRERAAASTTLLGKVGNTIMAGLARVGEDALASLAGYPVGGCGEELACGVVPALGRAPGRTASGRATDQFGNVLGPSGKPMIHSVRHATRKAAKDAARQAGQGAPVHHPFPQRGQPHFQPADRAGNKIPASPHHEYP